MRPAPTSWRVGKPADSRRPREGLCGELYNPALESARHSPQRSNPPGRGILVLQPCLRSMANQLTSHWNRSLTMSRQAAVRHRRHRPRQAASRPQACGSGAAGRPVQRTRAMFTAETPRPPASACRMCQRPVQRRWHSIGDSRCSAAQTPISFADRCFEEAGHPAAVPRREFPLRFFTECQ